MINSVAVQSQVYKYWVFHNTAHAPGKGSGWGKNNSFGSQNINSMTEHRLLLTIVFKTMQVVGLLQTQEAINEYVFMLSTSIT